MNETINPSGWPRPSGYANAVLANGRFLAISGQIGWNERNELVGDDFLQQAHQALRNVMTILRAAGGEAAHLVRLTWYVTDIAAYRACGKQLGPVWRAVMGRNFPAMAVIGVSALVAVFFVFMIPVSRQPDAGASLSGTIEQMKAALSMTPPMQHQDAVAPVTAVSTTSAAATTNVTASGNVPEYQTIRSSSESSPPVNHEQSEKLLEQFMRWQQKPASTQ